LKERHEAEDTKEERQEQVQVQRGIDQRKFYYAIGTVLISALIDIIVHLLKIK